MSQFQVVASRRTGASVSDRDHRISQPNQGHRIDPGNNVSGSVKMPHLLSNPIPVVHRRKELGFYPAFQVLCTPFEYPKD